MATPRSDVGPVVGFVEEITFQDQMCHKLGNSATSGVKSFVYRDFGTALRNPIPVDVASGCFQGLWNCGRFCSQCGQVGDIPTMNLIPALTEQIAKKQHTDRGSANLLLVSIFEPRNYAHRICLAPSSATMKRLSQPMFFFGLQRDLILRTGGNVTAT